MDLQRIISHPAVRTARAAIHARDAATIEEQIRIVSIPAPSGQEQERGAYVESRFRALGLGDAHVDEVGNVIARLPRAGSKAGSADAPVLVSAHLDTIFPCGTPIQPRWMGERILAPGITDNARGLTAMLTMAAVIRDASIATRRPIVFVASVGEEGLGDLRGVKHLFARRSAYREASAFISVDGAGATRIVHRAIGARRLRVTFKGLGGHSWGDRGLASPVNALGLAVSRLRSLRAPDDPGSTINIGRIGGGTSVNAIPASAWLEIDLRAVDAKDLAALEREARGALAAALDDEIARSTRGVPLVMEIEEIGDRPCGETPANSPLVEAAASATRLLGMLPELVASSTDANVPISLGIPSITIGAGGRAGGVHTSDEWFENAGGPTGIERALLTVLAMAGVG